MKLLAPIILTLWLTTPTMAQRDRDLDSRDEYEAMILHNIQATTRAERIAADKEHQVMAVNIAKLEVQIEALKDKLDWIQKLIGGTVGSGGAIAGGYKLISRLRGKDDSPDSPEV